MPLADAGGLFFSGRCSIVSVRAYPRLSVCAGCCYVLGERPPRRAREWARYPVAFRQPQRAFLQQLLQTGVLSATQEMRAQVLLCADQNTPPVRTFAQIARALSISPRTVVRVRRRFVEQGIEALFPGATLRMRQAAGEDAETPSPRPARSGAPGARLSQAETRGARS